MRPAADTTGRGARAKPLFAIVPDGYLMQRWFDDRGRAERRMIKDPERSELWDLVWRLAREGWSVRSIVDELDRRRWVTAPRKRGHQPRPFDANRIRLALNNPLYAGLQVGRVHEPTCDPSGKPCCAQRTEVVGDGNWDGYVTAEDFERLRAARAERGHVERRAKGGRPPVGYLLGNGVARCECGSPMDCVTDRHVRKDGTRPRRYVCRTHRERPQDCAVRPIDATVVDTAVAANLTSFLGDVDLWRERVVVDRRAERDRMSREVERATAAVAEEERRVDRLAAEWERWLNEGDDARADAVLDGLTNRRAERDRAQTRLQAAVDARAAVAGGTEPTDALLDFFNGLRAELTGRVARAEGDVKRLAACMRDYFQRVELTVTEEGVRIAPVLSAAATERIFRTMLDEEDMAYAFGGEPLRDEDCTTGPDGCVATGGESVIPPPLRGFAVAARNRSITFV